MPEMPIPCIVFGVGAVAATLVGLRCLRVRATSTKLKDPEVRKNSEEEEATAYAILARLADENDLDVQGGSVRRSSSRFCFGVEHGDYNGTELFGVGTDRFIWLAYKPNGTKQVRIFSENFKDDGLIEFSVGETPPPLSVPNAWSRFPFGCDYILNKEGLPTRQGFDAVVYGNIPGGGMSRSASLTVNLLLTMMEVNGLHVKEEFKIIELAQAVENIYIGSPCGQLDQIMIYFAKEGYGTHFNPTSKTISYVPLGAGAPDFRIMSLDTGTIRPGLEKSSYKIRRAECEQLVKLLKSKGYPIQNLASVRTSDLYHKILAEFEGTHPHLCERLTYLYNAQQRFYQMLDAWRKGDIATVGDIFRADGHGLRDEYRISGPELETMCDLVRTVDGVLGERMLGGGDKGAAGALVLVDAVELVERAVEIGYPRCYPKLHNQYAVHSCKVVDGIKLLPGI